MKIKSQAGSVLLSTLSFLILLSVAAVSMMEMAKGTYTLSLRNELRAQAREVAESEMEFVYYQYMTKVMTAIPASDVPNTMTAWCDNAQVPASYNRSPMLAVHQAQGFTVGRSIYYDPTYDYVYGTMPGTTKIGKLYYTTVKIEVRAGPNSPFQNTLPVRVGRRFSSSSTSIFQYGIFYQGDLEMAPGGNVTITGDISANGSIYMGSSGGGVLTLNKQVRYLGTGYFNQDSNGNTVYRKPGTPTGGALSPPVWGTSQASQLETLNQPENLLSGTDPVEAVTRRPDLFASTNDVYRALIVPPPLQSNEYPNYDSSKGDDPAISVQRVYNRAGLIVTVNTSNQITVTKVIQGVSTDVTATYGSAISAAKSVYDQREGKNVAVTDVDLSALKTLIAADNALAPDNNHRFNGVLYVNLQNSTSTAPSAMRLINGASLPDAINDQGFSVASNAGVYVKGDYNTTTTNLADGTRPPAMIMGDALTLLSSAWNDANASSPLTSRVAAAGNTTVNSGILVGNTSATSTTASGGVQNVVRYLENWNGRYAVFNGSIGRLLESKSFVAPFQQPGVVYGIPQTRSFNFDPNLLKHTPAGGPTTTGFTRGTFFTW